VTFTENSFVRDTLIRTSATHAQLAPGMTEVVVSVTPVIWLTLGLGHALCHTWALRQVKPRRRRFDRVRVVIRTDWDVVLLSGGRRVPRWPRRGTSKGTVL